MFRRSALTRAGQWDESVQVCTDYDLYFRLLLAGATLKAAPNAKSLYRHWSVAQAVHVNPLLRVSTRLRLLNRAAEALATTDRMTERRRHAFEQSALKCIRSLYHFDRERGPGRVQQTPGVERPGRAVIVRVRAALRPGLSPRRIGCRGNNRDVGPTCAQSRGIPGRVTDRFRCARPNDWSWSTSAAGHA